MEVTILQDNSFAIYQVKDGQDYHLLRFASMEELRRDGQRLRRDVHKVLTAAEGNTFPDKAAAEQFLRDEGFLVYKLLDTLSRSVYAKASGSSMSS